MPTTATNSSRQIRCGSGDLAHYATMLIDAATNTAHHPARWDLAQILYLETPAVNEPLQNNDIPSLMIAGAFQCMF